MNIYTKRILIANDIIQQILNASMTSIHGKIVGEVLRNEFREACLGSGSRDKALLQHIAQKTNHCQVCANGAVLLAYIRRFDSVDYDSFYSMTQCGWNGLGNGFFSTNNPVLKIFSKRLLNEMEFLFENRSYSWHIKFTREEQRRLADFRGVLLQRGKENMPSETALSYDDILLIEIMRELINNDGRRILTNP